MLRPLLLAILLCFPGVPVLASLPVWNAKSPIVRIDSGDRTPIVAVTIPDQSLSLSAGSFSIDLSEVFSDTEGNALSFSAVSNKNGIATTSIEGSLLTITPVSLGTCRIRATARDDDSGKADDTFTLTIRSNLPPALAPEINLGNQVLFTGGTPLNLDLSTLFLDPDEDTLFYAAASDDENIAQVAINQETLTISPRRAGVTSISLSADDKNGGIIRESFVVEVLNGYPASITAEVHVAFEDYRDQGNYRMVALPGDQSILISNTTSGEPNKDWVAFAPDTSQSGFLIEYKRSSDFVLTPGRGIWFLSKEDWVQPAKSVTTVSLTDEGTFEIPLHSGWNIISNPLDKDIRWSDVALQNNASQGIWRWDHGYQQIDTLYSTAHIQEAYYFNNTENLKTLALPYFFTLTSSKKQATTGLSDMHGAKLEAVSQTSRQRSKVAFTWASAASEGFDRLDQLAPPAHFNPFILSLKPVHPDFKSQPLAVEARPAAARTHRFDLELQTDQDEHIIFRLSDAENLSTANGEPYPAEQLEHIVLVNKLDTKSYNLKEPHEQQIFVDAGTTPFSLYIGERDEIEQELSGLKPSIFSLKQNYPNPFTPFTTIEYSIPEQQHVDLSVFDLMGRHIITLHRGEKEAGLHRVQWHGRDQNQHNVANGVYFYRLQTSSWIQSNKMTLIR